MMMDTSPKATSLTRRLVDQHLMLGLGSLFLCVAAALVLTWRESFTHLTAAVLISPLLVLLCGSLVVRRTVGAYAQIDAQLRQCVRSPTVVPHALRPLACDSATAAGWNLIVGRLSERHALAQLEERLATTVPARNDPQARLTLDSLCEGVALCHADGGILLANRALAVLLGAASPAELVGQHLPDLVLGIVAPPEPELQARITSAAQPCVLELPRTTELADGVFRIARSPLPDKSEETPRVLWTIRDITQQKLAETMRDQFIFTATHELRTPLTNIKAYAETLALTESLDVEKQKNFCNIINSEATRLARFVDELLNISQMEAGALSLAKRSTELARLIDEVLQNIQPQIEQKEIEFTTSIPPKLPELLLDKDKVSAALTNLLGNAVKYTPPAGHVCLRIESDSSFLHFHVEDTGIGISAEDLPRMFQKFFRSGDPRVREITGSGLGLAFTHEVARLHGGRLSVQSEWNRGSQFTFSLPLPREKD